MLVCAVFFTFVAFTSVVAVRVTKPRAAARNPESLDGAPSYLNVLIGHHDPTTVPSREQAVAELKDQLTLMTWNVEKLGRNAPPKHVSFVQQSLANYTLAYSPDVIALQEIEACSYVGDAVHGYECTDTVIPSFVEEKNPRTVLGGVLLHKATEFVSSRKNRVMQEKEWHDNIKFHKDIDGKTLIGRHSEECTWKAYNGCNKVHADILRTNSIDLSLLPNRWQPELYAALRDGIRIFNVHLFAGVSISRLTNEMRAARRTFQMRSLLWLSEVWNNDDKTEHKPMTVYLGDFNTRGDQDLRRIVSAAGDYGVVPWCPANRGKCMNTTSQHKTSKAGYLDQMVFGMRPESVGFTLNTTATVLKQAGPRSGGHSDHNPLLLSIRVGSRG